MHDEEKDNELEELFASFEKQFAKCEEKFSEIEHTLKAVRAEHDDSGETEPETSA